MIKKINYQKMKDTNNIITDEIRDNIKEKVKWCSIFGNTADYVDCQVIIGNMVHNYIINRDLSIEDQFIDRYEKCTQYEIKIDNRVIEANVMIAAGSDGTRYCYINYSSESQSDGNTVIIEMNVHDSIICDENYFTVIIYPKAVNTPPLVRVYNGDNFEPEVILDFADRRNSVYNSIDSAYRISKKTVITEPEITTPILPYTAKQDDVLKYLSSVYLDHDVTVIGKDKMRLTEYEIDFDNGNTFEYINGIDIEKFIEERCTIIDEISEDIRETFIKAFKLSTAFTTGTMYNTIVLTTSEEKYIKTLWEENKVNLYYSGNNILAHVNLISDKDTKMMENAHINVTEQLWIVYSPDCKNISGIMSSSCDRSETETFFVICGNEHKMTSKREIFKGGDNHGSFIKYSYYDYTKYNFVAQYTKAANNSNYSGEICYQSPELSCKFLLNEYNQVEQIIDICSSLYAIDDIYHDAVVRDRFGRYRRYNDAVATYLP